MHSIKTVAVAALLSTTAFGGAFAADAIGLPPAPAATPAAVPVYDDQAGFDWSGFYAGVSVGGVTDYSDDGETDITAGGHVGMNAAFDFFVVGAELGLDAVFEEDEMYAYGTVLGRAGVVLTDNLMAYGAAGYGSDFGADNGIGEHILAGGGLEFAVTDDVSVRGQYLHGWEQTEDAGSEDMHKFTVGASFHF
ncbi:outer membrane protein [Pelagibacterium montanilacus]|uniref:outer membrane protein n=1 Tax=Pelagibacterium montanilacus TaxID=2185280 RepID=UPI000F8DEBD9|nr:outer membrane beta-barrel protein [Pelagibacterium montanilacus]